MFCYTSSIFFSFLILDTVLISFFAQSSAEMSIGGFLFSNHSPLSIVTFFFVFFHSESVVTPLLARTRSQSSCVCVEHHQSDNRKRGKLCEMLGKQRRARGPGDWYPSDLRLYIYIYTTSHTTAQVIRFQLLFPPFFSFFILFFFLFRLSYVNINQHAMGFSSIGQVLACI